MGTYTATVTLPTPGAATVTVTGSDPGSPSGHASVNVVGATTAAQLVLSAPAQTTVGSRVGVTVTAEDANGHVAAGYAGTVHFTSSDGGAVLPADYTFTAANGGTVTLPVTFQTAGAQSLTVADTAQDSLSATQNVAVHFPSANENYVNSLFQQLLGRPADADGLAFWSSILDKGADRAGVVQMLESSPEFHQELVVNAFNALLNRNPDPGALAAFTARLNGGASIDDVAAVLMSSNEYYQTRGGGTDAGYLASLYHDILNRPLDSGGAAFLEGLLPGRGTRTSVVQVIAKSPEAEQDVVRNLFQHFLHRDPDDAALSYYAGTLESGGRSEGVMTALLASDEFFTMASS
jgi:hypothetical protein